MLTVKGILLTIKIGQKIKNALLLYFNHGKSNTDTIPENNYLKEDIFKAEVA